MGRPHYDSGIVDVEQVHILRQPYRAVMAPRAEKVQTPDVDAEAFEQGDYQSEYLRAVPWGTNVAATVGYGHSGLSSNGALKTRKNPNVRGFQGTEPRWQPEGGMQYNITDAKLPEDYGSELRRRHDYTEAGFVTERLTGESISYPDPQLRRAKTLVPVTAPADLSAYGRTEIGSSARPTIYRPVTMVSNYDADRDAIGIVNPNQTTKYIQHRDVLSILTPLFSTFVKIGDSVVPIKFKDPNYTVIQAQASMPLELPLPDGSTVKLKDYNWVVVQNVNAPSELIFEVPPMMKNKPKLTPDSDVLMRVYSAFEGAGHPVDIHGAERQPLRDRHLNVGVATPVVSQIYDHFNHNDQAKTFRDSKLYTSAFDGYQITPTSLQPSHVQLRQRPQLNLQPEPIASYPFV